MFKRIFLMLCGSLVAYTGVGYSAPARMDSTTENVRGDETPGELVLLMYSKYKIAHPDGLDGPPSAPMIKAFTGYANNFMSTDYSVLNKAQRVDLARIIYRYSDRFPKETLLQFSVDQQRALGMTDPDIRDLMDVVQDIRDGQTLTKEQAVKVRLLMPFILKSPTTFIKELNPLTQYASINDQLFTSKDLAYLREASRDASGLTAADAKLLTRLAQRRDNGPLSTDETHAIERLLLNAPIGALNGLDAKDIIAIHRVVQNHPKLFGLDAVRGFNMTYDNNQAIQMRMDRTHQGTGGQRMDTTRGTLDQDRSGNQGMMNRPETAPTRPMIQQTPSGARGNR